MRGAVEPHRLAGAEAGSARRRGVNCPAIPDPHDRTGTEAYYMTVVLSPHAARVSEILLRMGAVHCNLESPYTFTSGWVTVRFM